MNSEQWEQLWREQAPPPSAVNLDRFMAGLRDEPDQWEQESDDNDRWLLKLQGIGLVVSLPALLVRGGEWAAWLAPLSNVAFVAWYWSRRRQRRRIYADYGLPLRERLERIELLLRRRAAGKPDLVFAVVLCGLFGVMMWRLMSRLGLGVTPAVGLSVFWLMGMGWSYRLQARRDRVRLQETLAKLERARRQLGGP
jgi:hypothetical protein